MTDEQVIDSGQQSQVSAVEPQASPQSENVSAAPAESPKPAPAEKTYTQPQVNAIAAKEARKAAEQAEARFRAEFAQNQQQSQQQQNTQAAPSVGGMPQMSQEQIQHLIRQEAFNMSRQHQAQQIEDNWVSSIEAEKQADPEFADLYDALNIEAQPALIVAMHGMENRAQVVKDLALNPSKYANILMLAHSGSMKLAEKELAALSNSIKANEAAKKGPKVDAPLGQIKPSNIGGDDGNYSVADYQKMDWLRG